MIELAFLLFGYCSIACLMLILTKSDYMNPAVVVPLMFALCTAAAIYNFFLHGTEVGFEAACLLMFTTLVLSLSAYLASRLVIGDAGSSCDWEPICQIIKVPVWLTIAAIVLCIGATIFYYHDLTQGMSNLGYSGDWNQMMNSYRVASSFRELEEGEGVSGLANLLYKIMTAIAFLFSYIGIVNMSADSKHKRKHTIMFIPAIVACVCVVFTGGRMGMIRLVAGCLLVAWVVLNARKKWRFRLKISSVLKVVLLVIAASTAFWAVGSAVGRQITSGPLDYITGYIGYSMVLFSDYLINPGVSYAKLFGGETFVGIYNFLGNHLGIDEYIYTYHMEWRYIGDLSLGNVYTAYRYWLHDFGTMGMLAIAVLYGIFYGTFYAKARHYRSGSRRQFNYPLLMLSYIVYGVFLIPIKDCLLATEFVVTTPFVLIVMYALGRYIESIQVTSRETHLSSHRNKLPINHLTTLQASGSARTERRVQRNGGRGVSVESS